MFNRNKATPFTEVPIRDNFYQTSAFYPMPVTLISTLDESGQTNLGAYSLVFPYIISGEHSMLLISRGSSNTAQNILRTKQAAINFIPDNHKYMHNAVELGYPGDTTEEKMKLSIFTLIPSLREGGPYPQIVKEAIQVFETRWDDSHAYKINEQEYHFVLRIEKIVMQEHWAEELEEGKKFPHIPVDYGFRDGQSFWFSDWSRPYHVDVPRHKQDDAERIKFMADRIDPEIKWEMQACEMLLRVPRVFLKRVLKGVIEKAKERGLTVVTAELMEQINAERKGKS
jgi:flavin reductase (DIM6/NTAB) family NADH-FMN oxidoreductase RutF